MRFYPKIFKFGPGRNCYTLPVSATGSLWSGFGGWHYRTCSFALTPPLHRRPKQSQSVCQIIQPGVHFISIGEYFNQFQAEQFI
ncbi:hypothetical protein [Spirosoma litoris]